MSSWWTDRRLAGLAALGSLCLLGGCMSQPTATYRSTYQSVETGDDFSKSLTNLIEIAAQDNLGPELAFRASERLILTELEQESAGVTSSDSRVFNQPSFDTTFDNGVLKWTQGLELQQFKTNPSGGTKNTLDRTDVLEKVEWSPFGLPKFTAWLDSRTSKDDTFVNQSDVETVLQIEDARGPFSFLYSIENQVFEDNEVGVDRERDQQLFRGTYRDTFLDDTLSVNMSVFSDTSKTRVNTPGSLALPLTEVFGADGLSLLDPTPAISILAATPGLTDQPVFAPTGINIGGFVSGGLTNWNMGLDLPPGKTIDLLALHTSVAVDAFLVNQFSFSVWASDDNNFWTLVTGSATYTYNSTDPEPYFRIVIPAVTKQYLKVVNTASPPGAPAVFVTELRAFEPDLGAGSSGSTAEISTQNLTGNVSWRATDTLTVGYDLLLQKVMNEVSGTVTRDETRADHGLSGTWTPTDIVTVSLRASDQDTKDPAQVDETFNSINGLVSVRPLDTVDFVFSYNSTDRSIAGVDTLATEAYQARVAAELLKTLHGEILVEMNTQDDFANARMIERFVVGANLIAEVTPDLDMTIGLRNEDAQVTGPGAAGIPDPSETIGIFQVVFRPSDQLTAEADLEWRDTFAGSGLDQRFRIDWIPFPDGALDLQLDAQHQQDDVFGTGSNRYLLLTRWTLNPKAFVELNYAVLEPQDSESTTSVTFAVNVRL